VSTYLDANILVALLIPDPLTPRATAAVARLADPLMVSDLAALEVASTVARKVRDGALSAKDGRLALANLDTWTGAADRIELDGSDVSAADAIVRRFDINLHGSDALHVAMALRVGASLLTLDGKMKTNAKKLGVQVV
jgi:predicted nucleic acid-binding protein